MSGLLPQEYFRLLLEGILCEEIFIFFRSKKLIIVNSAA